MFYIQLKQTLREIQRREIDKQLRLKQNGNQNESRRRTTSEAERLGLVPGSLPVEPPRRQLPLPEARQLHRSEE